MKKSLFINKNEVPPSPPPPLANKNYLVREFLISPLPGPTSETRTDSDGQTPKSLDGKAEVLLSRRQIFVPQHGIENLPLSIYLNILNLLPGISAGRRLKGAVE